jgi:hypothetical protein
MSTQSRFVDFRCDEFTQLDEFPTPSPVCFECDPNPVRYIGCMNEIEILELILSIVACVAGLYLGFWLRKMAIRLQLSRVVRLLSRVRQRSASEPTFLRPSRGRRAERHDREKVNAAGRRTGVL